MTKIYAELSIVNSKINIVNDLNLLTKLPSNPKSCKIIGELNQRGITNTESHWVYKTDTIETPYLEVISEIFCNSLQPIIFQLKDYIKKKKCEAYICFVISLGEEGVSIYINKQLMNLANILSSEIYCDGL